MTSTLFSESTVTRAEARKIQDSISDRLHRLARCRVAFDVQISDAYRARSNVAPGVPERCRIVYQRAGEQAWHVTAFGEDGRVLSDSARDGAWIEAGGKRWHHGYLPTFQSEPENELDAVFTDEEDRIEAQRDARNNELYSLLWPMDLAAGHLYANLSLLSAPLLRETWQFNRIPNSGQLVCRCRTNYSPTEFQFSAWQYLQWRVARLWRPEPDILEYFGKKSVPRTEFEFILNEGHGHLAEQFRMIDPLGSSDSIESVEAWNDQVTFADGFMIPRTHQVYCSSADGEVLCRSTLIPEESAFGVNIPLSIRAVDRTIQCVDW